MRTGSGGVVEQKHCNNDTDLATVVAVATMTMILRHGRSTAKKRQNGVDPPASMI